MDRTTNRLIYGVLVVLLGLLLLRFGFEVCNPRVGRDTRIVRSKGICGGYNDLREVPGRLVGSVRSAIRRAAAEFSCAPPWSETAIHSLELSMPHEGGWFRLLATRGADGAVEVQWKADRDDRGPHQDEATKREQMGPAEAELRPELLDRLLESSTRTTCKRRLPEPYMLHCDCSASMSFETVDGQRAEIEFVQTAPGRWVSRVREPGAIVPFGDLSFEDEARVESGDLGFVGHDGAGLVYEAALALRDAALAAGPPSGRNWRSVPLLNP